MDSKVCTRCKIEKNFGDCYNNYTECKICNSKGNLERHHENKEKISNQ